MNPELQKMVFDQLEALVKDNIGDDFAVTEAPGRLDVDTQKSVVIEGRKRDNVNLLSIIIQKHHIGFYFMPVYIDEDIRAGLSEPLAKMLKGKSCFHCKKELSEERMKEIADLIQSGVTLYREKDWL